MRTKLEREHQEWRQTPESEVVMDCYRRLATAAADRGATFDMTRLALGRVRWELAKIGEPALGAPKFQVFDAFLEQIRLEPIRETPPLEPHVQSPVRRPGGRNA